MTDRERLIVLLLEHCDYKGQIDCKEDCERCLAEYLIANGVVVREKGEWTADGLCSVCGCDIPVMEDNFCPFCGADMRKESKK